MKSTFLTESMTDERILDLIRFSVGIASLGLSTWLALNMCEMKMMSLLTKMEDGCSPQVRIFLVLGSVSFLTNVVLRFLIICESRRHFSSMNAPARERALLLSMVTVVLVLAMLLAQVAPTLGQKHMSASR